LRQVFTNLVTNAIDAIGQRGQLQLSIEMALENQVVVRVRDSGCGIPPENLKNIFEPFFTTKGDKGTGIGLWVIKGIVDKLGGRIEVDSATTGETGTCFSIFLPAARHNGGGIPAAADEAEAAMPSQPVTQNRSVG
jgi:signal transduction histidine kinase